MSSELDKFSSQMDSKVLQELREYAQSSKRRISDILSEAVSAHLESVRIRPAFRRAVDEVLTDHEELLSRLAK